MRDDYSDEFITIKAGMAIIFSSGMYSDYNFGEVFIAAQDFNVADEMKKAFFEFLDHQTKEDIKDAEMGFSLNFGYEELEAYLIRQGKIIMSNCRNIHLSDSYNSYDPKWINEWKKSKKKGK